jgi:hypothetical protein
MSGLDAERTVTRDEAAEYLREFADKLAGDGEGFGDRSTTGRTRTAGSDAGERETAATDSTGESGTTATDTAADENRTTNAAARTQGATEEPGRDRAGESEVDGAQSQGKVTFLVGNDSATVHPPAEVTLGVEVGEDSSMMSSGAETVTFSLHWDAEAVPEDDELRIE